MPEHGERDDGRTQPCEAVGLPVAEKLVMPPGYGDTTTTQSWSDVSARLAAAKPYWLATCWTSASTSARGPAGWPGRP
jgi:hypothetical protein